MTPTDRINAYAQTPQAVPVARYHIGSALLATRIGSRERADTARRMAKVQRRARNRLDWADGERGGALLFALLLVTACLVTAIGIGAELVARAHGIG